MSIHDGCFSPSACAEIHRLAREHCGRGDDGSSVFVRPPHNDVPLSPLENAIDSALEVLGDGGRPGKVEYWSRSEYMNIDAHADIDEVQLEEESALRSPERGHVLYLQVGEGLRGPTCVFPDKQIGWDSDGVGPGNLLDLVTVPAVQGRILRFPGGAMHSVPRPPNRWLLTDEEEAKLVEKETDEETDDEEEWSDFSEDDDPYWDDDDDDDVDEDVERSVLLFNTWSDDEPGPMGVNGDSSTGAMPGGIVLNDADAAAFSKAQEVRQLAEWEEEYGPDALSIRCNPGSEWRPLTLTLRAGDDEHDQTAAGRTDVRIKLMGTRERRVHPEDCVRVAGSRAALGLALEEEADPCLILLEEK